MTEQTNAPFALNNRQQIANQRNRTLVNLVDELKGAELFNRQKKNLNDIVNLSKNKSVIIFFL